MSLAPTPWMNERDRFHRWQFARAQHPSSSGPRSLSIPFLYVLNLAAYAGLTFFPDILGVQSASVSIPFRVAVVVISVFLVFNGVRSRRLKLGRPGQFFLLFWAVYLTRLLFDTYIRPIPLARPVEVYWSFSVGVIIIPCLALFVRPRIEDLDTALIALQTTLLVVALASWVYGMSAFEIDGRLSGNTTQNPIQLGHMGAAMVICGGFSLLTGRSRGVLWSRVFNYASVACGMIVLFLSGSRGPLLGSLVVLAVWAAASVRSRFSTRRQIIVAIFVALAVYASLFVVARRQGSLFDRIEYIERADNREGDIRMRLARMAWQSFLDSPLYGSAVDLVGMGYPHNFLLESFMATGLIGGLLFTGLFMYGMLRTFRLVMSTHPAAWVGLLYIQYAIAGVLSGTIYDNFQFWYLYAGLSVLPLLESKRLMPQRKRRVSTAPNGKPKSIQPCH